MNLSYAILDTVPMGIFILDHHYKVIFWNECLEHWTGLKRQTMIGPEIFESYPHLRSSKYQKRLDILFSGGPPVVFSSNLHKHIIPVKLERGGFQVQHTVVTRLEGSDPGKIIFTIQDVTDLSNKLADYHRLRVAADQANRVKSEFLANMSHDLKTPLNSIIGFADLLESELKEEVHREQLKGILASGEVLLGLMNNVMDLTRLEADKITISPHPTSIREVVEKIQYVFSQEIKSKGLEFVLDTPKDFPDILMLDEIRFKQILLNLVGNAVKFTDSGSITIRAESEPIKGVNNRIKLRIVVSDTGKGIAPDQKELIFAPFQQATRQDHKKYGGSGLGLAICARLLKKMGGKISLESELAKGTSFTITLSNIEIFQLDELH